MQQQLISTAKTKMDAALTHLQGELSSVRSGRASGGVVENVKINVYGQEMPLKSIATISTPDAKTIQIQPWDTGNLQSIEKAIAENQTLGLNPSSDGHVIRINVPPMSEETRAQLVRLIKEKAEAATVSMRGARHDAINAAKKVEKDKQMSQDERVKIEKEADNLIESFQKQIHGLIETKERELTQT